MTNICAYLYIYMSMVHIYYLMYILDVPSCVHHLYNDEDELCDKLQSDICMHNRLVLNFDFLFVLIICPLAVAHICQIYVQ